MCKLCSHNLVIPHLTCATDSQFSSNMTQFCGGNISLQQCSFHAKQFIATELNWTCQGEQSQVSSSDVICLPWIMIYYLPLPATHPVLAPPSLFLDCPLTLWSQPFSWLMISRIVIFLDNTDEVLSNYIFSTLKSVITTFKWKHLNAKRFL